MIVVLSGTESLAEIVRSDPQVQRRFSTLYLPPVSAHTDVTAFQELLCRYCSKAGLEFIGAADLIERLFHASRYRFGRCIETIVGAIEEALTFGDNYLDIDHFADAWGLQEGCPLDRNVFLAPDFMAINPDRSTNDIVPAGRKRHRRV